MATASASTPVPSILEAEPGYQSICFELVCQLRSESPELQERMGLDPELAACPELPIEQMDDLLLAGERYLHTLFGIAEWKVDRPKGVSAEQAEHMAAKALRKIEAAVAAAEAGA